MLKGKRICLRMLEEEDLLKRVQWINDDSVNSTLRFDLPISLARTKKWFGNLLNNTNRKDFSILFLEKQQLIGMAGLINIDFRNRKAELYITIGETNYWGQGLSYEILTILCRYGFDELNLRRIYLFTLAGNEKVRHIYEKFGFKLEGVSRQDHYKNGKYQDICCYGILSDELSKI